MWEDEKKHEHPMLSAQRTWKEEHVWEGTELSETTKQMI